jgi:hypothetical protein
MHGARCGRLWGPGPLVACILLLSTVSLPHGEKPTRRSNMCQAVSHCSAPAPTLSLFLCSQSPPASQMVLARASSFFTPSQSWYRMASLQARCVCVGGGGGNRAKYYSQKM